MLNTAAPAFCTDAYRNGMKVQVCLNDYKGKWLLVYFFPSDFSFVCPTELEATGKLYEDFLDIGADVVAISTDSVLAHKVFHDVSPCAHHVQFPLLSDRSGQISKSYGVYSQKGSAHRASFLVDPKGMIRYYAVYPDAVGREVSEILRVLKAVQKYDQTSEQQPAGWRPGMDGIVADIAIAGRI